MTSEEHIGHEVRIRIQEQNSIDLKTAIKELTKEMHEQFKWTIGIMITLFGGLILTKFI